MARYLFQPSATVEGLKGLLKEGGSGRVEAVSKMMESLGGKLEALYFAFGDTDAFVIVDLPDNVSATAASLIAAASGAWKVKTTVLITPEEVDEATKLAREMSAAYRPPGQ